jgi:polyhydroxyalkanoate synthesis regulator phasin
VRWRSRSRSGNGAGSGGGHARMAARDNSFERLALAAVGVVALTADRLDELATELSERGGMRRDEVRALLDSAVARWRGDATRLGEKASDSLAALLNQLGVVTREDFEELELRVSQLEHRLRLVERPRSVS